MFPILDTEKICLAQLTSLHVADTCIDFKTCAAAAYSTASGSGLGPIVVVINTDVYSDINGHLQGSLHGPDVIIEMSKTWS